MSFLKSIFSKKSTFYKLLVIFVVWIFCMTIASAITIALSQVIHEEITQLKTTQALLQIFGFIAATFICTYLFDQNTKRYLNLSGGERRRVQVARVISQILDNPEGKLLLLDEPTANLDPLHEHLTMSLFKDICKMGASCITVLHSVELALNYSDNSILLDNGKILASGKTSDVLTSKNVSELFKLNCKIITGLQHAVVFDLQK